jgi:hypothetical protein
VSSTGVADVKIAGKPVAFDHVLSSLTSRHGRAAVDDGPLSSSASLQLIDVDRQRFTAGFRVGVALEVTATDGPLFTGHVTDANLTGTDLQLTGIGPLGLLARFPILGAFPAQKWSERVGELFSRAGRISSLVLEVGSRDPMLVALPSDARNFGRMLVDLSTDNAAAIADTPDGRVLVQAVDSRPGTPPMELPPQTVLYAPSWAMIDDVENEVTVTYGADVQLVESDARSVAVFGPRPSTVQTVIASRVDAQAVALERLNRRSFPDWTVSGATVLARLPAKLGTPVTLGPLPASAPTPTYQGVIEGWTLQLTGRDWSTVLALSDPRLSGIGLRWQDL